MKHKVQTKGQKKKDKQIERNVLSQNSQQNHFDENYFSVGSIVSYSGKMLIYFEEGFAQMC